MPDSSNTLPISAATEELSKLIERHAAHAVRFLEWQSGFSTQVLCDRATTSALGFVLSLNETPEQVHEAARILPNYGFLHLRHFEPRKGQQNEIMSYSAYPTHAGLRFDVVLINGWRRLECLLPASQVVSEQGIIIVSGWNLSRFPVDKRLFKVVVEGNEFVVLQPRQFLPEAILKNDEKKAVIIPANGFRAATELELTLPSIKAYAARIGADCLVVGEKTCVSPHRIKFEAFKAAQGYDRVIVIDADVIIRPSSPNLFEIVPADLLGAFAEGAYFDREGWCEEISALYQIEPELKTNEYFNSGVMVLSRAHYGLLGDLASAIIFGHPQFEQGFLNARRIALGIGLFPLPPDMNFIPDPGHQSLDWRFGFFIHYAGSGKLRFLHTAVWLDQTGDRKTFSAIPFRAALIRSRLIQQAIEQMSGQTVFILDPTDFAVHQPFAMIVHTPEHGVVAWFSEMDHLHEERLCMYGPYIRLGAGRWRAEFREKDDSAFYFPGAAIDIVSNLSLNTITSKQPWPHDGVLEFSVATEVDHLEFRIFRTAAAAEFAYVRLMRLGEATTPTS